MGAPKRSETPVVIRALLVWHRDEAIDFLDTEWAEAVPRLYQTTLDQAGLPAPRQDRFSGFRPLDRQMLNAAVGELEAAGQRIRVVRAPFPEDEPILPNSAITARGHVQIAVRDPSIIKAWWFQRGLETAVSGDRL